MEKYYLIRCDEDGEITVDELTEEILLERLEADDYYGDIDFYNKMPSNNDPNYWNASLIIKGHIAVPKPKEVVTKFEID